MVRQCFDTENKVLSQSNGIIPSRYPNLRYESFASVDRNGNVASYDNRGNSYNYSEADSANIHEYIYKQIEDLHKSILGQIKNTQAAARNFRFDDWFIAKKLIILLTLKNIIESMWNWKWLHDFHL